MRLYSVPDVTALVLKAMRDQNVFSIIAVNRNEIEVTQSSGRISQAFKIRIESDDKDPAL